jgi:hypothetical protein
MKITSLLENTCENEKFQTEHGLSLYIGITSSTYFYYLSSISPQNALLIVGFPDVQQLRRCCWRVRVYSYMPTNSLFIVWVPNVQRLRRCHGEYRKPLLYLHKYFVY